MRGLVWILVAALLFGCKSVLTEKGLQTELERFVAEKDARIGIAVIIGGTDTVCVNGSDAFPMLSVYKFPQALAIADYCRQNCILFSDSINIDANEIKPNTWSPLREAYGIRNLRLPIDELLAYTLQQSDNNACDILFRFVGSPSRVDSVIKAKGYRDIHIRSTEDEMHTDQSLCYVNCSTPLEMARLFDDFDAQGDSLIAGLMENCQTGTDRLAKPLQYVGVKLGHKTGTGDSTAEGRIIAVNDCGYVIFPDGTHYSIAVFIADSGYDPATTSSLIAEISEIVFKQVSASYRGDKSGLN